MKNAERDSKPGHITHGDIFDDLGFSPAETLEAKIKAEIWQALVRHIQQHKLTQTDLVKQLKVHQPDVSNLLQGKIGRISIKRLIQFASRLDLDAHVENKLSKAHGVSVNAKSTKPRKKLVKTSTIAA